MRPKLYIETSVVSYLVARRNQRDLVVAANQELTREWWDTRRQAFDLYASAVVLVESARGDPDFAAARLGILRVLALAEVTEEAKNLANALVRQGGLHAGASEDALHIAIAAAAGMDYLLTWNCRHIANAFIIPRVNAVILRNGFQPPLIYTPQELMNEDEDA